MERNPRIYTYLTIPFFEHSLPLAMRGASGAFLGCWSEIFNRSIYESFLLRNFHFLPYEVRELKIEKELGGK